MYDAEMREQRLPHVEHDTTEMLDLNPNRHAWYGNTDSIDSVAVTCEAHVLATED